MAILAVTLIEGVEPEEERSAPHTVELYEVTFEMAIDHGPFDATQEVFLKYFLSLFGMTHIAHILLVHGMEVNRTRVASPDQVESIYSSIRKSSDPEKVMFISGVYPNGRQAYYAVDLSD